MLTNAFSDKAEQPTDGELSAALGPSRALWDRLVSGLAAQQGVTIEEWNSYSRKAGWSLRLKRKKRNIVYLAPSTGGFTAALVLGGKAVQAARDSGLSKRALQIIDEAPRYPEGVGIRIEVKGPADVALVEKLAEIKLAN
jgi:hypothetical protein